MSITALRVRLADVKAKAAKNDYTYIGNVFRQSADWRTHARGAAHQRYKRNAGVWQAPENMPRHTSTCSRAYYCDNWPSGLRHVGSAYDVCRAEHSRCVEHTGWYTNSFRDGTLSGHVLQLPARGGKPVYIPGTAHSEWDVVTLFPLDMYDDVLDCAQAADQYAKHAAEEECEYQAKGQANQQIKDKREEIVALRTEARALIREMKAAQRSGLANFPAICAALRGNLADLRAESRKAHKRIQALTDNYWSAVPN